MVLQADTGCMGQAETLQPVGSGSPGQHQRGVHCLGHPAVQICSQLIIYPCYHWLWIPWARHKPLS